MVAVTVSAGTVLEKYRYSPYGVSGAEGTSGFPFRFTGQKLDPETGLYYYKARYYDPETGRFLQTDPVGYRDQMNLYAYVGNDPINATDSTGEFGVFGAIAGGVLELGRQLITGEAQAAFGSTTSALLKGDVAGAVQAARANAGAIGASLAKIGISAVAGAAGVGVGKGVAALAGATAARVAGSTAVKVGTNVLLNIAGNTVGGASIAVAQNAAFNGIDGKPLLDGAGRAATIGATFGGLGATGEFLATADSSLLANATGNIIVDSAGNAFNPGAASGLADGLSLTISNAGGAATEAIKSSCEALGHCAE